MVLEIDWQGAAQLREAFGPEQVSIFILPPSVAALESRLKARGQDDAATIRGRMQKARSEMSHFDDYDYLIVNDQFEDAVADLLAIVRSERLRRARQELRHGSLLTQLLDQQP